MPTEECDQFSLFQVRALPTGRWLRVCGPHGLRCIGLALECGAKAEAERVPAWGPQRCQWGEPWALSTMPDEEPSDVG